MLKRYVHKGRHHRGPGRVPAYFVTWALRQARALRDNIRMLDPEHKTYPPSHVDSWLQLQRESWHRVHGTPLVVPVRPDVDALSAGGWQAGVD